MPDLYNQLEELRNKLETHYKEVQDFEYTIEKGILYCLQTRNGKMNTAAMVRTSVEMVEERLITKEQALLRIKPDMLEQLASPSDWMHSHKAEPLGTRITCFTRRCIRSCCV
ncbi:MAG: PEP/pyruvate-binding domain-containing protein [Cytophagales bacterium]|nr:PEP/pyruvate-binding domain-containing protein [Cytophagales bacterium]